jgi:hypothetical protein
MLRGQLLLFQVGLPVRNVLPAIRRRSSKCDAIHRRYPICLPDWNRPPRTARGARGVDIQLHLGDHKRPDINVKFVRIDGPAAFNNSDSLASYKLAGGYRKRGGGKADRQDACLLDWTGLDWTGLD